MLDAKLTAPDGFEGLLMRTTLALDDDVLRASKGLAAQQHKTLGQVVSELLRQALQQRTEQHLATARNGIQLLPVQRTALPVTPDLVRELDHEIP